MSHAARNERIALGLSLLILLAGPQAEARGSRVPFIYPLDDGAYRFVVRPNGDPDKRHVYRGGHITAYLKMTGEKVWEKYLYQVRMDPEVSPDLQGVYIRQIYFDEPHHLVVRNDRGEWFVLERRTGDLLRDVKFKRMEPAPTPVPPKGDEDQVPVEPLLKGEYLVEADPGITYGRQKLRVTDVTTGRELWEKKVVLPKGINGGRSPIAFFLLNGEGELDVTFEDSSIHRLDILTGRSIR